MARDAAKFLINHAWELACLNTPGFRGSHYT